MKFSFIDRLTNQNRLLDESFDFSFHLRLAHWPVLVTQRKYEKEKFARESLPEDYDLKQTVVRLKISLSVGFQDFWFRFLLIFRQTLG